MTYMHSERPNWAGRLGFQMMTSNQYREFAEECDRLAIEANESTPRY